MLLRGLRQETADLDLCVSKELAEELDLDHCRMDESGSYTPFECVQMKVNLGKYPFDIIDGYQCETLESILSLKRRLMRPKDLRDIEVIETVLAGKTAHRDDATALKEEKTMFQYRSEILVVSTKWFSDKANESDANELDALLNQRASEGWELVTYDYMATSLQVKGAFIVTFRKKV